MGKILIGGVKYAKSESMKVSRSGGSGGSENVTTVVAEKIVLSDTPPEPVCINMADSLDIDCITVVAEANEKCIFMEGDVPAIDVIPDISPQDEPCQEYADKPEFEIITINGEPPVLNENIDEEGIVYIKVTDVVEIQISNYDENVVYDTPYTSLDNKFQEHFGSNYLFDNGDGTLIFVSDEFNDFLDGVDILIWIYATDGEKCRNVSEHWFKIRTMKKSIAPILKSHPTEESTSGHIDILNFSNDNKYVELHGCEKLSNLVDERDGTISFDSTYLTDTSKNIAYLYVSVIEPLKYKSQEVFVTIEITFPENWSPIFEIVGNNEFEGCEYMTGVILNYRDNLVIDYVSLASYPPSGDAINKVEFFNVNRAVFTAPTMTNNSSEHRDKEVAFKLVMHVTYTHAIGEYQTIASKTLIGCDAYCTPYGTADFHSQYLTMVLKVVYFQPTYVYSVGKSVVENDPYNCKQNTIEVASLYEVTHRDGFDLAVIRWYGMDWFYGVSNEFIGTYLYAENLNGIIDRSYLNTTRAIVGTTICYHGGE